jgi:hypothetical protein
MNETFDCHLRDHHYDDRAVREAAVAYVTTKSGYLGEAEMRASLELKASNPEQLATALATLESDIDIAQEAAYRVLATAWESGDADAIRERLAQSKEHLELITAAALAVIILFGMYLIKPPLEEEEIEEKETVQTTPEGSQKEEITVLRRRKYRSFGQSLKSVLPWLKDDG